MKIVKKIIGGIVDLFMLIVIIAAVGVTLVSLTSNNDGISKIGKYIPLNVKTESMQDTIYKGDFIIIEEVEPNTLKVGDVISFKAAEQEQIIIKTHRIVEVVEENGNIKFITQGDNAIAADIVPVYTSDVVGIWNGVRLPKVGYVLNFVSGRYGFLFCIVLPLFILFIYQLYRFIVVIMEERSKAKIQDEAAILEAAARIQAERAAKTEKDE